MIGGRFTARQIGTTLVTAAATDGKSTALRKAAEPVLTRLASRFLLTEANGKRAKDPVAHFHLSNGARVERLNMAGDTSDKGAKESATFMVNYLYDPGKIEDWHEDYAGDGKRNASSAVRRLVGSGQWPVVGGQSTRRRG